MANNILMECPVCEGCGFVDVNIGGPDTKEEPCVMCETQGSISHVRARQLLLDFCFGIDQALAHKRNEYRCHHE